MLPILDGFHAGIKKCDCVLAVAHQRSSLLNALNPHCCDLFWSDRGWFKPKASALERGSAIVGSVIGNVILDIALAGCRADQ